MSDLARLMLDHSPQMQVLVNPADLQILMANAPLLLALGYSLAQIQSLKITEVESALPDVFYWEDVRNGEYQALQDQEGQYRCHNGDLLTVRKSIQRVDCDGTPLLLLQAVPTESERKAEDVLAHTLSQLRATLESTGNGILVMDWHGRIDSMNRLFGAMWSVPPGLLEAPDHAAALDFIATQVLETELFRDRLTTTMDNRATSDLLHHLGGAVFEVTSRPQYLDSQIIGRVFGFQDITQRIQAETSLRESRDQLEERVRARTFDLNAANETLTQEKERQAFLITRLEEAQSQLIQAGRMASIGQLAAGVAHEINNPVGFVNSNLGSLQRYVANLLMLLAAYEQTEINLPVSALHVLKQVKQEVDIDFLREDVSSLLAESVDGLKRVTRIVQDLKNFAHVDEAERQFANLEDGLESTLRVVWNEVKYKADVVKEYAGIPPVACFASQLNQVFMNLLVNAAQAIKGHGTITLRTGQDEHELWVEVADTGEGIQPEHLARIFEPFFTTKPVGQGTGLGLSLAYGIVKKHQGRIEASSQPGSGSQFRIVLPKSPAAHPD